MFGSVLGMAGKVLGRFAFGFAEVPGEELGKDGFELGVRNELRALSGGGSASRPGALDLRIVLRLSFGSEGREPSPEYEVNNAFVDGRDKGSGESLPRTMGAGGQLLVSGYSLSSLSKLLPEIGFAGWFLYPRSSIVEISLTRASRCAIAIASRTSTPVRAIAAAA